MALVCKPFGDIITFTRASGATWFNSAGNLIGVDFSTSSNTIGTGSKTFTLDATAGVNRSWATGDTVLIVDQANSANNMTGAVTSYTASTQALVVNVTSTAGSGTIASWRIGNLMQRLDYDPSTLAARGLLIEEARTNLLLQSAAFNTTWSANNVTITADTTASPDGGTNGDGMLATVAGGYVSQTSQSFTAGSTITVSVFAKKNASDFLRVELGNLVSCWFNLNTGATASNSAGSGNVLFSSKSIQAISNGWYRCVLTVTTSTITTLLTSIYATDTDGNSSSINSSIFLWGAQAEVGDFATSYIPTTTTALTRSADVASVNTLSPWYNATEGTLYAEVALANLSATANQNAMQFSDGTTSNRIALYRQSSALGTALSFGATINGSAWATTATRKLALGNQSGNSALVENGTITGTGTGTTAQTVNQLRLGSNHDGTGGFTNGYLRRITYYPRRLSNAELQAITA